MQRFQSRHRYVQTIVEIDLVRSVKDGSFFGQLDRNGVERVVSRHIVEGNKEYCENYCRQQDIKRQEYQQGQRKPLPCASGARLLPAQHFRAAPLLLGGERLRLRTGRRRLLPGGRALGGPLSVRPCGRPCGLLLPFLPYGSLFQGRALPSIKFPDCIIACFVELGKGFFTICSEKSYLTVWIRFI